MDGTMTLRVDDEQLATLKFGVGQPVLRNEDPALVQGRGRYTDDVNAPGQVYMAMVRSTSLHVTLALKRAPLCSNKMRWLTACSTSPLVLCVSISCCPMVVARLLALHCPVTSSACR